MNQPDQRLQSVFEKYKRFDLVPFLEHIRDDARYEGSDVHNTLTSCVSEAPGWRDRVYVTIGGAAAEKYLEAARACLGKAKASMTGIESADYLQTRLSAAMAIPPFESSLRPGEGISRGLNPYTDWTLSRLSIERPPKGWIIIIGSDWYPVSDIFEGGPTEDHVDWFDYLAQPFADKDPFWNNVWKWVLDRYDLERKEWQLFAPKAAEKFMAENQVGLVFHNLIPYLRPPGIHKSAVDWRNTQLRNPMLTAAFAEDLRLLRAKLGKSCVAVCPGSKTCEVLDAAKFLPTRVKSWGRHPSYGLSRDSVDVTMAEVLACLDDAIAADDGSLQDLT